ncbi:hypothetical protein [Photorhabdus hindustanensis]|uniref:hypothetical protein n=1 Tax=Photorhabdus hindustanensis TaxID=2918802 RepID=UPI002000644F|nr:hypothetical protein [Photorhabdus hindustanensis]
MDSISTRLDTLEGKTADSNPDDEEEDAKVTGDAAYRRNIIADAEIICPGFKPTGDKSLKRQVLNHAMRTGDSLKSFGISDFSKTPKATVDAVFNAAVEINRQKNRLNPTAFQTVDAASSAVGSKHSTPAQLNELYANIWKRNK